MFKETIKSATIIILSFFLGTIFGVFVVASRYQICSAGTSRGASHVFRVNRITGKTEFAFFLGDKGINWQEIKESEKNGDINNSSE